MHINHFQFITTKIHNDTLNVCTRHAYNGNSALCSCSTENSVLRNNRLLCISVLHHLPYFAILFLAIIN